jgi:alkanesulfonate monooxygenase SsuD/methylene tetrahydromethanopterin reductase-like flavin-dependent oxidoreductase (luciferase family)
LVEAIRLVRRLWTEDWVEHEGTYFRADGVRLYDRPDTPVPVYVAASGPKSGRIAGAESDGWITDRGTFLHDAKTRQAFEEGARESGRDPAALPRIVELYAVAGDHAQALEAAQVWRFLPSFNHVVNVAGPHNVQRIAEEKAPLEKVIANWVVSSDPADHIAAARDLIDRGATHVQIHSPQHDQRAFIEFYGWHVLPALR